MNWLWKYMRSGVILGAICTCMAVVLAFGLPGRVRAVSILPGEILGVRAEQGFPLVQVQPTPGWIPVEDETSILQRQQPHKFPPRELLPDLRTLVPFSLVLDIEPGTRQRTLRFSNSIWNSGEGTLEVNGIQFDGRSRVRVQQHVYRADGTFQARDAGVFHFDSEHGHWHWENFSVYELWSVSANGELAELILSSDKIGYCLIDVARELGPRTPEGELMLPLDPPEFRQYTNCDAALQGLSSGWTDTYRNHLPGQSLEISTLPEGLYALRSTVDPENRILETNEENNSAVTYFVLSADRVVLLDKPPRLDHQRYSVE